MYCPCIYGILTKCSFCLCLHLFVYFQVCLGAEAEDKFHMVEVEGLTYDGKSTKVPLVILKPSVMPSVSKQLSQTDADIVYLFLCVGRF